MLDVWLCYELCNTLSLKISVCWFLKRLLLCFKHTPTHDEEQTVWFFMSVIFATWLMSRAEASAGWRGSSGCFCQAQVHVQAQVKISKVKVMSGPGQRTQNCTIFLVSKSVKVYLSLTLMRVKLVFFACSGWHPGPCPDVVSSCSEEQRTPVEN